MSLLESIDGLITHTLTIRRRAKGTFVDGKYRKNSTTTTVTADVVLMPAFGLNRVIGGADMRGRVDNQSTNDVLHFYTRTEVHPNSKDYDADEVIDLNGGDWTITRVETWNDPVSGDSFFHALLTRQTKGSA